MTKEKWQDILANIKDKFEVEDEGQEQLEEEGGVDIEYIIFKSPLGRLRLEFVSKPVVEDKKTIYSRRIGSETKVDYVYSDKEKVEKLMAYKWDEGSDEWVEIEAGAFGN